MARDAQQVWFKRLGAASLLLCLWGGETFAIGNFNPKPEELRLLPAYCGPRAQPWGNDSNHPEVAPWAAMFGGDWIHLHHYCSALLNKLQAYRSIGAKSKAGFNEVLNEVGYVERNVSAGFVLAAEMAVLKGEALEQVGQQPAALQAYRQAIEKKRDFVSAYLRLADLQVKLGKPKEAEETIYQGLTQKPDSKGLKRRYTELGGKKPMPEAPPVTEAKTPAPKPDTTVKTETSAVSTKSDAVSEKPADAVDQPPKPIGAGTNKWCRFCTEGTPPLDPPASTPATAPTSGK